eukprot:c16701_g1_i1 orf=322-855(-)
MGDHMQDVELAGNEGRPSFVKPAGGAGYSDLFGARTRIVELVLRVSVAVLTVISLSLIASDQGFSTVPAFNYLLATTVLGFLYSFFESLIAGYHVALSGRSFLPFSFHAYSTAAADLICCILLLSGSSAAFGVTTGANYTNNFISEANGSASMALIAFLLMLPLIAISSQRLSGLVR